MAFNLDTSVAVSETTEVQLRHPVTDELLFDGEKPVQIVIYGTSSKVYRNAMLALQNKRLKNAQKRTSGISAELLADEELDLLVKCSIRADELLYEGKEVKGADAFRELYSDLRFKWVRDQVDAAIPDTSRFLPQEAND